MNNVNKNYKLYKVDGSDKPFLYVYVAPILVHNFSESYSGFLVIDEGKVNASTTASESGGSIGGNYVCLYLDKESSNIILATNNYAGGFGENASGCDFYCLSDGIVSKIVSYNRISQVIENYDQSILQKNAELFYDENNLPYNTVTINDATYVTEYHLNDKQVSHQKFQKIVERCLTIPMNSSLYYNN